MVARYPPLGCACRGRRPWPERLCRPPGHCGAVSATGVNAFRAANTPCEVALYSDLHLSVHPGIASHQRRCRRAGRRRCNAGHGHGLGAAVCQPTLYVAGNHEFWLGHWPAPMAELRQQAQGSSPCAYSNARVAAPGRCGFWVVHACGSGLPAVRLARINARKTCRWRRNLLRDFHRIGVAPGFPDRFTPAVSQLLFRPVGHLAGGALCRAFDGPTVVVTLRRPRQHCPRSL